MISSRKVLLALVAVLFGTSLLGARWTGWLTKPITYAVIETQRPARWTAANLRSEAPARFDQTGDEDELRYRLDLAKRYNDALWQENKELKAQIAAYDVITEIRDLNQEQLVEAKVSRYAPGVVNPSMTLLRGSRDGIEKGNAVVFRANLLGFVESVGPASCVVSLITKPSYRSEIHIMPPNQDRMENNWPVVARVEADSRGRLFSDIDKDITEALREGDIVSVSDVLRPSANGFVLGTIASIQAHPDRPLQLNRVLIEPRTPIGKQAKVTVVTKRKDQAP